MEDRKEVFTQLETAGDDGYGPLKCKIIISDRGIYHNNYWLIRRSTGGGYIRGIWPIWASEKYSPEP